MIDGKIKLLFSILVFSIGLSACTGQSKKAQVFEVIGVANDISKEEEKIIRSNKGNTFNPVGAIKPASSISVAPASSNANAIVLRIHKKESLYSAISRLHKISGYTRLIYDLSFGAPSPDKIKSSKDYTTKTDQELLPQIEVVFKDSYPGVRLFAAGDVGGHALVITDKPYPSWHSLRIYDVPKGTLMDAAANLALTIGWTLEAENGYSAKNFSIDNSYPIVIAPGDPKTSFTSLLSTYPAKAQLRPNTRTATIVERVLPKQN
ncbi:hypothetical protein [Cellvibrio sp. QJXJ]|uniref:hypothetical protein n=1 Tax=Cellvibrio sp. QJXJ TaxID=2964606 RepID=UPI0021C4025A|nr:hypothetical protein [Cellvibrio sp. QJXJ]UUA75192.1 hypothetical protein NNX04_22300 [Cellvibrio sp. QJXJ]